MCLKSMIYSETLNTDILTFFEEGVMPSLSLLMMLFLLQDRMLLCHKGSLLVAASVFNLSSTRTPRSFSFQLVVP